MNTLVLNFALKHTQGIVACALTHIQVSQPDKKGGYICLATPTRVFATFMVGEVSDDQKANDYHQFCMEKARRLGQNPDHVSSWESRNENANQYGGAVKVGDFIFSFSGFSEHWDEAVSIVLAHRCSPNGIGVPLFCKIKNISANSHMGLLLGKYHDVL